jgi:chromosome segregation ATPase
MGDPNPQGFVMVIEQDGSTWYEAPGVLARIAELEMQVADLDELYRELNLACNDHITRWMKAEAENELVEADFDRMQRDWKHEKIRAKQAEARCKELAEETADRIGALNTAEAELAELKGENALLREAVEADVLWHDSEDNHKTTTFDERMDLCHYSEWLAKRAIGRDVPDEYEGIPRLVLRFRARAEEGSG